MFRFDVDTSPITEFYQLNSVHNYCWVVAGKPIKVFRPNIINPKSNRLNVISG